MNPVVLYANERSSAVNNELKIKVMESKDKHEKELEREHLENMEANKLRAEHKIKENESTRKTNRLWLWLGVLILILILLWWLYSIGIFEDMTGISNGN